MKAHSPKWWNMWWSYETVISFQEFFRVVFSNKNKKLYQGASRDVLYRRGVFFCLEVEGMRCFEVNKMKIWRDLPCQVYRLMTISLGTSSVFSWINLEGSVPVPDSPDSISKGEFGLEAFAHSPLMREILSFDFNMIFGNKLEPFDGEDGIIIWVSDDFD